MGFLEIETGILVQFFNNSKNQSSWIRINLLISNLEFLYHYLLNFFAQFRFFINLFITPWKFKWKKNPLRLWSAFIFRSSSLQKVLFKKVSLTQTREKYQAFWSKKWDILVCYLRKVPELLRFLEGLKRIEVDTDETLRVGLMNRKRKIRIF